MNIFGWRMCNVVWYNGSDAYVSKFILKATGEGVTEESKKLLDQCIEEGNGEVLKIDPLYYVDFDNIVALKTYEDSNSEYERSLYNAYERFKEMWF